MKLNYRDRILLTAVIVLLVWAAGIMLFIKPAIEDLGDAQTALEDAKVTLSDLEQQIDADKDLDARIEEAYDAASKIAMNFYDFQEAQVATQNVDDLLDADNLTNLNMSISSYSTVALQPYMYASNVVTTDMDSLVVDYENEGVVSEDNVDVNSEITEGSEQSLLTPQTIGCYTISFDFNGNIDDVKNFCEKLKSNEKKTLVLQSIDVSFGSEEEGEAAASESDEVSGSMSLNMIVLRKLADPTAE